MLQTNCKVQYGKTNSNQKLFFRHLLHPSSAGGGNKFGSAGKEKPQLQKKGTLAELLSQHKGKNWQSFEEDLEAEKGKGLIGVDTVCAFILGTEQGGIYLYEPKSNQLNRIFQVN